MLDKNPAVTAAQQTTIDTMRKVVRGVLVTPIPPDRLPPGHEGRIAVTVLNQDAIDGDFEVNPDGSVEVTYDPWDDLDKQLRKSGKFDELEPDEWTGHANWAPKKEDEQ